jgi:uncharacterized protein YndB with AHSA1/START domain
MSMQDGLRETVPAVHQEVMVSAPPERAFEVFTTGFGHWWPKTHTIMTAPVAEAVIEPRQGGRCYDRGTDGTICEWGQVLEFTPPRRLVLAWQINGQWQYEPDIQQASRVTITFTPQDGRTRVTLIHDDFDRHGADGASVAAGVGSPNGWAGALQLFATAAVEGQVH